VVETTRYIVFHLHVYFCTAKYVIVRPFLYFLKVWMIGRRYNEVAELHAALSTSCAHPSFSAFKFPNKSILNTFSSHTMERRRSGFEAFFQVHCFYGSYLLYISAFDPGYQAGSGC